MTYRCRKAINVVPKGKLVPVWRVDVWDENNRNCTYFDTYNKEDSERKAKAYCEKRRDEDINIKYYVKCNGLVNHYDTLDECWEFIGNEPFGALYEIRYSDTMEYVESEVPY